jgi:hypothetical protein
LTYYDGEAFISLWGRFYGNLLGKQNKRNAKNKTEGVKNNRTFWFGQLGNKILNKY